MADRKEAYSFKKDMESLHHNVDLLERDHTPVATKRCCERINSILVRIQENRDRSYIPYEVKEYFRDED